MMRWTTYLLPLGLVVALLGLGGIAVATAGMVLTLVVFFVIAFMVSLIALAVGVHRREKALEPDAQQPAMDGALGAGTRSLPE